ncbi:alpha/beta hydrolase [Alkaliphilus peptidifermentans]|uniref:Pimeloyl-ACP methyl ester carboxylesterase n=1 Tax=Alkaliphilus peptidifermentans DSM 18978 TaxID=1120976 RepID=A0A1G5LEV9_9FIRM|nr:alpha/beta hydrolase [Alkaliphilus peptidifermentans]SCZ11011.1 hypothetical protein SAMN03080606_04330 [Alkaliphilus peptidifermentans DSM 18978]
MRGLFLYGLGCTNEIWKEMKSYLFNMDITYVEYPHEIIKEAKSTSDIASWVFDKYRHQDYDFIVGHSMGGIIALELVSKFEMQSDKVIFIESNIKSAGAFYRNLLMPKNMEEYGEKVTRMIKREIEYYTGSLIESLQENFDYSEYIKGTESNIFGIYGDRGVKNYTNRIIDLNLDDEILSRIKFYFIEESCHMPMIENPSDLYLSIKDILCET